MVTKGELPKLYAAKLAKDMLPKLYELEAIEIFFFFLALVDVPLRERSKLNRKGDYSSS